MLHAVPTLQDENGEGQVAARQGTIKELNFQE